MRELLVEDLNHVTGGHIPHGTPYTAQQLKQMGETLRTHTAPPGGYYCCGFYEPSPGSKTLAYDPARSRLPWIGE